MSELGRVSVRVDLHYESLSVTLVVPGFSSSIFEVGGEAEGRHPETSGTRGSLILYASTIDPMGQNGT